MSSKIALNDLFAKLDNHETELLKVGDLKSFDGQNTFFSLVSIRNRNAKRFLS
jgi:hypothetical protein